MVDEEIAFEEAEAQAHIEPEDSQNEAVADSLAAATADDQCGPEPAYSLVL